MILRARVKTPEEMPPGLPCCERMLIQLQAFRQTIQVESSAKLKRSRCQFCRAPFMGMRVVALRGWRIDPRVWEIEESAK